MEEKLLHYIWQFRLVNSLQTISGEKIIIINPGSHNHDSGPDFFNA
ncbi:MAG: DUF2851 family protein, partial [Bacteroidia bacterium]|nr:DUF2851 family protein [Bacteroidia bacterium]